MDAEGVPVMLADALPVELVLALLVTDALALPVALLLEVAVTDDEADEV